MPGAASRENGKRGGRPKGRENKRTAALRARLLRDEALTVEATVEAIRRGQQYDARDLFDAAGNLKPIHQLSEIEAWAIAGFDVVRRGPDTIVKVKLIDRGPYVALAAKHQGMFPTEKHEHTFKLEDLVAASRGAAG